MSVKVTEYVMLTSDLKFMLMEDGSEHYCFVAYSSVKVCIKLSAVSQG